MSFQAWADLPAHHAASLSRGRPPGYRKAGALPAGGRKNTAGRPAWVAATCRCRLFIWYGQCRRGCIPFRPVLTPGRTARDRTSTQQRKDYDMNDEKKIGFSVELENNRVDLWANGDDETLVNLAVAATANIVATAYQNTPAGDATPRQHNGHQRRSDRAGGHHHFRLSLPRPEHCGKAQRTGRRPKLPVL